MDAARRFGRRVGAPLDGVLRRATAAGAADHLGGGLGEGRARARGRSQDCARGHRAGRDLDLLGVLLDTGRLVCGLRQKVGGELGVVLDPFFERTLDETDLLEQDAGIGGALVAVAAGGAGDERVDERGESGLDR